MWLSLLSDTQPIHNTLCIFIQSNHTLTLGRMIERRSTAQRSSGEPLTRSSSCEGDLSTETGESCSSELGLCSGLASSWQRSPPESLRLKLATGSRSTEEFDWSLEESCSLECSCLGEPQAGTSSVILVQESRSVVLSWRASENARPM